MADAAAIITRIRQLGANVVLDDAGLRLVNGTKLPAEAMTLLKQHRQAIADCLRAEQEEAVEERAAIIEFDGKVPRDWAEQFARILITRKPRGVDEADWSWFVHTCGLLVDEAPGRVPA